MSFQVLDKKTMREVSLDDFTELARNNNLMEFDIEGFALQEDERFCCVMNVVGLLMFQEKKNILFV